ncbi:unnamed protein product, partial [Didymodactylos carnosus]
MAELRLVELSEVEQRWNEHASKWNKWIGDDGDSNRQESSDPYLWKYVGDIKGLTVLDAGCGNGYLLVKLIEKGVFRAIGVDLSSNMIEIATQNIDRLIKTDKTKPELYHDSITELKSIKNNEIDVIISNY